MGPPSRRPPLRAPASFTPGDNDIQWLRVDVDPGSRGVFSFQPQIIPSNASS